MKASGSSKKHILLPYQREMDKLWKITFFFSLFLLILWIAPGRNWIGLGYVPPIPEPFDVIVILAAPAMIGVALFALLARGMAYVQARNDHLRIVTPFLRLKVSYRRIRMVRPTSVAKLIAHKKTDKAAQGSLSPFVGNTAVVIDLNGYPLSPRVLKIFLGTGMLLPDGIGLVLLIPDWMAFSTEFDSLKGAWQQRQALSRTSSGLYGSLRIR